MKKLLCVLMFGMVFGQTELTTRLYTINLDMSAYESIPIDMLNITGHDIASAIINVVFVDNQNDDTINLVYGCDVVEENEIIYSIPFFNTPVMSPPRTSIYVADQNCYIMNTSANPITNNSSLSMQVTAEFPDEDTGLNGDMNDDDSLDVIDVVMLVDVIINGGMGDVGSLINIVNG